MEEQLTTLINTYIGYVGKESRPDENGIECELQWIERCTYIDVIYELSRLIGRDDKETSKLFKNKTSNGE